MFNIVDLRFSPEVSEVGGGGDRAQQLKNQDVESSPSFSNVADFLVFFPPSLLSHTRQASLHSHLSCLPPAFNLPVSLFITARTIHDCPDRFSGAANSNPGYLRSLTLGISLGYSRVSLLPYLLFFSFYLFLTSSQRHPCNLTPRGHASSLRS